MNLRPSKAGDDARGWDACGDDNDGQPDAFADEHLVADSWGLSVTWELERSRR